MEITFPMTTKSGVQAAELINQKLLNSSFYFEQSVNQQVIARCHDTRLLYMVGSQIAACDYLHYSTYGYLVLTVSCELEAHRIRLEEPDAMEPEDHPHITWDTLTQTLVLSYHNHVGDHFRIEMRKP